jgi:hypothetical protein
MGSMADLASRMSREGRYFRGCRLLLFPEFPSELMTAYPVTPKMNKASFNSPEAILPLEPTLQFQGNI